MCSYFLLLISFVCPPRNEEIHPTYRVVPDAAWQQRLEVARIRHSG
nr:MAG TPA: hypothetical protein [Caudoviricetes sp.]